MTHALVRVQERLIRATTALRNADIPFAIAGGNAVAIWVARVDPGAVRNTPDVNLLLRRVDLTSAIRTLTQAEFSLQTEREGCVFLDGQPGEKRDLLQIVLERERNRPDDLLPNPDLTESVITSA